VDQLITRDEPGDAVQARLARQGVLADMAKLPGWQRAIVHDALEVAHSRDLKNPDGTLTGARYLSEVADSYEAARQAQHVQLVDVLRRAATAHVR
jgi:hypothetical protein